MKIAIIGAGEIGSTLARRFTSLGHEVAIANSRGPATLKTIAEETGARTADVSEVTSGADLVVIAIPQFRVVELPSDLLTGIVPGAAVVDTGNYYPRERDGFIAEIEAGKTESRWVSDKIGYPVVKAFNTIPAPVLRTSGTVGASERIGLPVAGDGVRAKEAVSGLVQDLGFDPVDAGDLDESWRQQPGQPAYPSSTSAVEARERLMKASPNRQPEFKVGPPKKQFWNGEEK